MKRCKPFIDHTGGDIFGESKAHVGIAFCLHRDKGTVTSTPPLCWNRFQTRPRPRCEVCGGEESNLKGGAADVFVSRVSHSMVTRREAFANNRWKSILLDGAPPALFSSHLPKPWPVRFPRTETADACLVIFHARR